MYFYIDAKRLAHPQARLIPMNFLRTVLHDSISDSDLESMRLPWAALTPRIEVLKHHDVICKYNSFVCIAMSHPGANDDELIHLSHELGISNDKLLGVAALSGRLTLVNRFIAELPNAALLNIINEDRYGAFRLAASGGHFPVMARLMEIAPGHVLNMIKADDYAAFQAVAEGGHLSVMERLITIAPAEKLNMIQARDYSAFQKAANAGHLDIMNRLIELASAKKTNMVKAGDYAAFRLAAENGHLAVMERLMVLAPAEVKQMIKAANYGAFYEAAGGGHLAILERIIALAPADRLKMIKADCFGAFRRAAIDGHLAVMEKIISLLLMERLTARASTPTVFNMIEADHYWAFVQTANGGYLHVMNRLVALAPSEVQNMIKAAEYRAFRWAAGNGHLHILERLMTLAPGEVQNMIKASNYGAFCSAAGDGQLDVMERLIALAPAEAQNMVAANNYDAFQYAVRGDHFSVINRLLSFSHVMAYAEIHEHEYSRFTHPFISAKLTLLRTQRHALETANPHAIFDVTDTEEAKNCFYILRNLIRRNDPTLLDDIRFLLEIPAVKALAHSEVTAGNPNELIRLALVMGNQGAAEILLNIPAVRDLAERNMFYRTEVEGRIDLGALARDRESSMRALSTAEQQRMVAALARYQPLMQGAGVGHLFEQLLEELANRYKRHPATITIDGVATVLPVDWDAFTHLTLTSIQREEALKAYYQHKDHCALRYLSRPNRWMALDANYVYINEDRTERWSTFEEYKPLIVMLWLAAQDVTVPPTDGHTLEGRVTHFVDELAQIGRAHNWDHSRTRVDGSGHSIEEEFDDLTGDKPSCFSGVKRRLFQSVIGHPLLKILTEQDIQQELRDFVRGHFTRLITAENRATLQNALTVYYGSVELSDAEPLKALNITTEQQAAFTQQLTAKYGVQFSIDPRFSRIIASAFTLVESTSNPSDSMHALKFAALVNLDQLLKPSVVAVQSGALAGAGAVRTIGLFAGAPARGLDSEPTNTIYSDSMNTI